MPALRSLASPPSLSQRVISHIPTAMQHPLVTPDDLNITNLGPCEVRSPGCNRDFAAEGGCWITDDDRIVLNDRMDSVREAMRIDIDPPSIELAGPRKDIYFKPEETSIAIVTCGGIYNIHRARRRSHTRPARRRLTYLAVSFLAPGVGVFPYLVFAGLGSRLSPSVLLLLSSIANMGIAVMILILAYSVAFQGALLSERVVKQDFIRWLLIGPFVGVLLILFLQLLPPLETILGLPRDTITVFVVMISTVIMPIV